MLRRISPAAVLLLSAALAQAQPRPSPEGVIAHRNLAYVKGGHERQKLDLYLPEQADGLSPVMIWIHGGAWLGGDKANCRPLRWGYVQRGYAVASLNYRLSQHALFPAQIQDCKAAIRWLRAHAADYGLDPEKFGVSGSSAGGHLAALVGTANGVTEFEVGAHLDQSSRVQAVGDYFGPTDFTQMDARAVAHARSKHDAPDSPESKLVGGPIQDPEFTSKVQAANPITYVSADDPPFLIVHGDADPLVPHHQSVLLHDALQAGGVPTHFITVQGGEHGRGFPVDQLTVIEGEFFDRHLRDSPAVEQWPPVKTTTVQSNLSTNP